MKSFFLSPLLTILFATNSSARIGDDRQLTELELSSLDFGGSGYRTIQARSHEYHFSSGFQGQLCASSRSSNCWTPQGISTYGPYITRSFYPKPDSQPYAAITVVKKSELVPTDIYYIFGIFTYDPTYYSNILLEFEEGEKCHAGDNVLSMINGTYYFFVACTSFVAIFSEMDIESDVKVVSGKTFHYVVRKQNVIKRRLQGVSFSFISRNEGTVDEFYSGRYDSASSSTDKLNLKKIRLSPTNDWQIEVLQEFTVSSSRAVKVQGATRIGNLMYLVESNEIRACKILPGPGEETADIDWCEVQGKFKDKENSNSLKFQGAETDSSGSLYVGTEFGNVGYPFYEIFAPHTSKYYDN